MPDLSSVYDFHRPPRQAVRNLLPGDRQVCQQAAGGIFGAFATNGTLKAVLAEASGPCSSRSGEGARPSLKIAFVRPPSGAV